MLGRRKVAANRRAEYRPLFLTLGVLRNVIYERRRVKTAARPKPGRPLCGAAESAPK
jgi:hypothetical protein